MNANKVSCKSKKTFIPAVAPIIRSKMTQTISDRMRLLLSERNWTQKEAAQRAKVQHTTINGLVSGRVAHVRAETALNICRAFSCNPYWFVLGEGKRSKLDVVPTFDPDTLSEVYLVLSEAIEQSGLTISPRRRAKLLNGYYANIMLGSEKPSVAEIINLLNAMS